MMKIDLVFFLFFFVCVLFLNVVKLVGYVWY